MKNTFSVLLVILFSTFCNHLLAQPINELKAKKIADNFFAKLNDKPIKLTSADSIEYEESTIPITSENKDTLYYVINNSTDNGFILLSADERVWPILGYSLDGKYSAENLPPAFVYWMETRKSEIEWIKQNVTQADSEVSQQWEALNNNNIPLESGTSSVAPLLQTTWNQGCYYNELCPTDEDGPCGHVWAGCVATAMAQVMKYWNYPTTGNGSHSYTHDTYGTQSADFESTIYQWSQMPNNVSSSNNSVATLLYHCGVAVNMDYSPTGSGAYGPRDEFVNYFKYSSNASYVYKSDYSSTEWVKLLKSELNLLRPIWYRGDDGSTGHAFVCDGYQADDYFHFNWGWGGYYDGYFYLGSLNPGSNTFNLDQGAIVNIIPTSLPDDYNGFFISDNNFQIEPFGGDDSLLIFSSSNWSAISNQSWLTFPANGSSGKSSLHFSAERNETGSTRSAEITISASGFGNQIVTISQSSDSIVNVTPGELYSQISTFLSNIKYLTINGSIDARDFLIMRDSIPNLTGIDLSNASIVSYTGTFGTSGASTVSYPANQVPDYAFNKPVLNSGKPILENIILPNTVISIGNYAFYRCSGLKSFPEGSSITTIGNYAFYSCKGLRSIVLPSSLTTINTYAFYYCTESDSIYIPSSVILIDNNAFRDFRGLINVDLNNTVYSSEDGVLFDKNKTTLIHCPTSKEGHYDVPSTVTTINNGAFYKCFKLTDIGLPIILTTLGSETFYGCSGLTDIQLPSSLTSIGTYAFQYCSALTSIVFPSKLVSIGNYAFRSCNRLSSISIPSSVTTIGSAAFYGDTSITKIEVFKTVPVNLSSSISVFYNVNKTTCSLYVPYISYDLYAVANQWKDFLKIIRMPGFSLSSTTANLRGSDNNTDSIIISSNITWSTSSNQPWLTINHTNGSGNDTLIFTAQANPFITQRVASVTVSAPGIENQIIEVTQLPGDTLLLVSQYELIIADTLGSNKSVNITSNTSWSVTSDQSWLDIDPESGTGNHQVVFTAQANPFITQRVASVTVSAPGIKDQIIEVTQKERVENLIPNYFEVNDTIISDNQFACFNALETIRVATEPNGVLIQNGSTVNFIAGKSIVFLPGFHAEAGSNVHAYITTDGSFCENDNIAIVENTSFEKSTDGVILPEDKSVDLLQKFVKIYPNPNNGQFTLELKNFQTSSAIYIYNLLGTQVYLSNTTSEVDHKINVSGLRKGIYIVKVIDGKEQFTRKIVVE